MADPSRQAALLALQNLETIATTTVTRDRIDLAHRKLGALRRVLGMIIQGAPASHINVAAIEADLAAVSGDAVELLKAALNGLELDFGLLATVGGAIRRFGIAHPGLWGTSWWEACRRDHFATTVQLDATTQRLRQALLGARATSGYIAVALQYPPRSAEWAMLLNSAGQIARDARDDAQATLQEWNLMRLAAETQFGSARRIFAIGGA